MELNGERWWQKTGFWTAVAATIGSIAIFLPDLADEVKAAMVVVGAWAAFFTAAKRAGPTVRESELPPDITVVTKPPDSDGTPQP